MDFFVHLQTGKRIESFIAAPSHALSLSGEPGAGKGMAARYIAACILQTELKSVENHPYVHILDGQASKTGIDEVRKVQTFLTLKVPGADSLKRAVIIENLDYLRHEAQNALLKMIEEPPADTIIIVTFSLNTRVLPTLHSRMQSVNIMPLDLEYAVKTLESKFNKKVITQNYYMSGGLAGLLAALLSREEHHPLVLAINEARNIIKMSRFQRLSRVDALLKNKELSPGLLLDGLYRLVDAGYKQSLNVAPKTSKELKTYASRLNLIEQSIHDLQDNVQAKLVFSRLFNRL